MLPLTYVLPIKAGPSDPLDDDLAAYLAAVATWVGDVVVVDGSDQDRFDDHRRRWPAGIRHVRPDRETRMGKVAGVLTGLDLARHDEVVLADDDVRWTRQQLAEAHRRLGAAEVVRPQNAFAPGTAWHARWDTGRTLVHRALGGDWPGTLAVRRSALPDGYAGDALFENLELVRTVLARGGREHLALDLVVDRRPPTAGRFLEQRVRQAYDEWARPWRLALALAILPTVARGRGRAAVRWASATILVAEVGRRRGGGHRVWGPTAPLWAPLWLGERAVTSWLAVDARLRGGVPYRGGRLPLAAHSVRQLRRGLDRRPAGYTAVGSAVSPGGAGGTRSTGFEPRPMSAESKAGSGTPGVLVGTAPDGRGGDDSVIDLTERTTKESG